MSLLERNTRDIVDRLEHIVLFFIPTQFSSGLGCFKTIMCNSSILIGPIFRLARTSGPKKMDQCHQTVFALLVRAWLGTRLHFNGQNTFSLRESAPGFLNYSNSVCLVGIHSAH